MQPSTTYRAKYIIVRIDLIIEDGFLTTTDDLKSGQILAVGAWAEYCGPKSQAIDLGSVVLMPALINAHTHLEFSDQTQPIASLDGSFAGWIENVIAKRSNPSTPLDSEQSDEIKRLACGQGWQESRASGTAGLGEILAFPDLDPLHRQLAESGDCALSVFYEVLGLGKERGGQSFAWATQACQNFFARMPPESVPSASSQAGTGKSQIKPVAVDEMISSQLVRTGPRVQVGLSPHAPYSTATTLYQKCAEYCIVHRLPLVTHLAETVEELELLQHRTGPLVDLLDRMGIWNSNAIDARSIRQVLQSLANVRRLLLIHCNYMLRSDWCWLLQQNPDYSVVFCPQTHHYFQHSTHPWPQMLQDGVNVALGTDSRASSPTLSLWQDVVLAANSNPTVDPSNVLRMATINGATALGIQDQVGTLQPGKRSQVLIAEPDFDSQGFDWAGLVNSPPPRWSTR